jgi:hypothetical protein
MQIKLKEITIRELAKGYKDNQEEGVIGYGGLLDIRPPYQREFIYKDKQRDAVIDSVTKEFPLNVMYWSVREDKKYEVIDGQQRTISVCQYIAGDYSINGLAFHNLPKDKQEIIYKYPLMIYLCSGTDSEKLEWFKTINIAGETLTDQEMRNAVYSGSWVSDAKRYFSKSNRPKIGDDYLSGSALRQEYLETVIEWISKGQIKEYMSKHQHDKNAKPLWEYFLEVIEWIKKTFPNYRKEMQGVQFGLLFNDYKNKSLDPKKLEKEIAKLMEDEDVTNKKGIYPYVLTRKERLLNIRAFTEKQKREAYEKQKGICPICKRKWKIQDMQADHINPWHDGGKTVSENCQMLCKEDNRQKSGK